MIGAQRAELQRLSVGDIEYTEQAGSKGCGVQDPGDEVTALQNYAYPLSNSPPDAGFNSRFEQKRLLDGPFQEGTPICTWDARQGLIGVVGMPLEEARFRFGEQVADGGPDESRADMVRQAQLFDQHVPYRGLPRT